MKYCVRCGQALSGNGWICGYCEDEDSSNSRKKITNKRDIINKAIEHDKSKNGDGLKRNKHKTTIRDDWD